MELRRELATGALGECGDEAIRQELLSRGMQSPPSARTISRILARHGAFDGRVRQRRPPPPPGWYLPKVASGSAELDSFDYIEGLVLRGKIGVCVLNGISLHSRLCTSWPLCRMAARDTVDCLVEHWRMHGLPQYAQFDNGTVFCGPHHYRDALGRVTRLCLTLGITPVFALPAEHGFQNMIESYNGRWQRLWSRFEFSGLEDLKARSAAYVAAANAKQAARREAAPERLPFPESWQPEDIRQPARKGQIVFLRRTDDRGAVSILGTSFLADKNWANRIVRAEVHLAENTIRIHALRRRDPASQPLLAEHSHTVVIRPLAPD